MTWLQQQDKVESLAARNALAARQCATLLSHMRQRIRHQLRQPGTLAWAFAAGAWFGNTPARKRASRTLALMQWVNTIVVLSKFLGHSIGLKPTEFNQPDCEPHGGIA
jgi:hypothetical protein